MKSDLSVDDPNLGLSLGVVREINLEPFTIGHDSPFSGSYSVNIPLELQYH